MDEITKPTPIKANTILLIVLALIALIGLLAAWDALTRYGVIIAAVYAAAAILSAAAWTVAVIVRVGYGLSRVRSDHRLSQAEANAQQIAIVDQIKLTETRMLTESRQLKASARKAEREADLFIVTAKRDEQVLISDGDSTRRFTAAHLQLSGQVNGVQIPATPEQIKAWAAWHGPRSQSTPALVQEIAPAETLPLLPALADCDNILIVGGKGSGKTTLLQWFEAERIQKGPVIVLDSHAEPGQWFSQVIGAGRKYSKIKDAMIALINKMDKRHQRRTQGHKNFTPICTIIDEFTLLPGYLKELGYKSQTYSFPMLTEGRKVEMSCLWGIHSDRVKATGFEGMGDLRECFDAIAYLKHVKGNYYALVDFGEGKEDIHYIPPGPFFVQPAPPAAEDLLSLPDEPEEPEPTSTNAYDPDQAEQIRSMYNDGKTKTEIAQSFGYNSNEGAIFYKIKAALEAAETATTTT